MRYAFLKSLLRNPVAVATGWTLYGMIWSRLCALVISVITARTLLPHEFGAFGYIQTCVMFFGVLASLGMSTTSARFISLHWVSKPARARQFARYAVIVSIAMGALAALMMIVFSATDLLMPDNIQRHAGLMRIVSVTMIFSAVAGTQTGILSGYRMFRGIARANFIASLIQPLVTVALVLLMRLDGAVYAIIASNLILCLTLQREVRRNFRVMASPGRSKAFYYISRLLYFGAPLTLSGIISNFAQWYTVSRLAAAESGTIQLAFYSVALQWRLALLFIPTAFSQVLLSFMVKDQKSAPSSLRARWTAIGSGFALSGMLAVLVGLAAPIIISLYGTIYLPALPVLIVICVTSVPMAVSQIAGQIVNADGHIIWSLAGNIIWAALLIAFSEWGMADGWSALGLSVCVLIAYTVLAILMMARALRPPLESWAPPKTPANRRMI